MMPSPYAGAQAPYPPPEGPIGFAPIPVVPSSVGWSPPSTTCPPGLEYLMGLDQLFVNQKLELIEALIGWETKNKYCATNNRGEPVFYIAEDSDICSRMCFGSYRACEFHLYDAGRREVLRMTRPLRCDSCCCPCCLQELEVYSGNTFLGSVVQDCSFWRPYFSVRDASGKTVLRIKGPCVRFCVAAFKIKSMDGQYRVGAIKKKWNGVCREALTDADMFDINFPIDLDVKIKAVLLGAALLLDFMYFEHSN